MGGFRDVPALYVEGVEDAGEYDEDAAESYAEDLFIDSEARDAAWPSPAEYTVPVPAAAQGYALRDVTLASVVFRRPACDGLVARLATDLPLCTSAAGPGRCFVAFVPLAGAPGDLVVYSAPASCWAAEGALVPERVLVRWQDASGGLLADMPEHTLQLTLGFE